jgi:hypothetical protein
MAADPHSAVLSEVLKVALDKGVDQVWLNVRPPNLEADNDAELMACNMDRLEVLLPKMMGDGLRGGRLGTISADPPSLRIWRTIARDLKTKTWFGRLSDLSHLLGATYEKPAFMLDAVFK